jgi:major vault protein
MAVDDKQNRDLTLTPDTYLYLQNETKNGVITVHRGPTNVNQTGQDKPVLFNPQTRRYQSCGLDQAVQQFPRAAEGDYVILENPSEDGSFLDGSSGPAKSLKKGCKIVIPGPWSEALYPGQIATMIEGHRLRSNQYLVAIIYNDQEAEKNWEKGTVVKAQVEHEVTKILPKGLPKPESFAVGTRIVIRGNDVSFYIPCTGVEVMRDDDGKYVRDAVTLEQLEYCCLIDESGKKEYPRGPAVVFPQPTQVFDKDGKSRRKFRPTELNTINGIHLKVTADFTGPDIENDASEDRDFKEGEELFVTGKTLSIYYPREELAIIEYGAGNKKHYSTAIPKGEGRYVINRETGEIRLEKGPRMYLADPRTEIPVRRGLTAEECALWYPNNKEALAYNNELAETIAKSPSGRSGVVSEGDYLKGQAKKKHSGAMYMADMESFRPEDVSDETVSDTITRGTKFTQPKTLTLNTKYDGVPKVEVWPGFAVLIVGAEGSRRVVTGPEIVLLQYDEKLGFMELSTGKPKTTDRLMRTAYLCVQNNQVGDIVGFESKDHVKGKVKISLRVNFEAETDEDRLKWFGTDNYVKFLTDHVRSMIAGMTKKYPVGQIKGDYVNLVRDAILGSKPEGSKRPGMEFENGMKVTEVEVLELTLDDAAISQMLDKAQTDVVRSNIEIQQAEKDLEATVRKQEIAQKKAVAIYETTRQALELETDKIGATLTLTLAAIDADLKKIEESKKTAEAQETLKDLSASSELSRQRSSAEQQFEFQTRSQALKIESLNAETKSAIERMVAAKDGLSESLVALGRDDMAVRLASAVNIERYITGDGIGSSIANLLSFAPSLKQFMERGEKIQENNGNRFAASSAK